MKSLIKNIGLFLLVFFSISNGWSVIEWDARLYGKENLPGFRTNVFLNGFSMLYKYSPPTDNHIRQIAILPQEHNTVISFSDKSPKGKYDRYLGEVKANSVPNKYPRQIKKGECKAQCTIYLDHKPNHTIFIRGFSFTRKGKGDMHIKRIAIKALEPGKSGKTFIAFRDKDTKDRFNYEIWYSNVPNYQITQKVILNKNAKDFAQQNYTRSKDSRNSGIVSFSFMFREKDHQIRGLSIVLGGRPEDKNTRLQMSFFDRNDDDKVSYFGEVYFFDPYATEDTATKNKGKRFTTPIQNIDRKNKAMQRPRSGGGSKPDRTRTYMK